MEDQKNLIGADELASKTRSYTLAAIATGPGIVGEALNAAAPSVAAPKATRLDFN